MWDKIGPAVKFADFAKECEEKKLKAFSSYRSLSEVLAKYDIQARTHPIEESPLEFKLCIDDILYRVKDMGPVVDSNEAMCCEYISTTLHTAVSFLKDLLILPQITVTGAESSATDWYFVLHSTKGIYCTRKTKHQISLTEDALDNPTGL